MNTITGSFGTLSIETALIEISSLSAGPDKNWTYTDQAGHRHYYDRGYPTLVTVIDETYWCEDCHEDHQDSHLACGECGEAIKPGMRGPSAFAEYMAGPPTFYLNGEPITSDAARELLEHEKQI